MHTNETTKTKKEIVTTLLALLFQEIRISKLIRLIIIKVNLK